MTARSAPSSLAPYWLVGLTGHRHLKDPVSVERALVEILKSLRTEIKGSLGCVSSIAIGADTLFARAAFSLSLPWRALLPTPASEFKNDFEGNDWQVAEQLLAQAIEVDIRVTPSTKNEAYLETGMDTVDQSDLLIAVWDEKPARGTGGTGDIVAYARSLRKPLIILNPETLVSRRESLDDHPFEDREMEYLNGLPDDTESAPPQLTTAPESLTRFFWKVDRMATRIAPHFRRWVASSIVLNTCATILVASTIAFALRLPILDSSIFIMTAAAMGLVVFLKFRKVHEKWIHCRVAAEICRSALATWELSRLVLPDIPGQAEAFARLKTSIRMMHLCSLPEVAPDIDHLKQGYISRRIDDQASYHRRRSTNLKRLRDRLIVLFWICSSLAIVRTVFVGAFGTVGLSEEVVHALSHFLPLALPCVAGCALALISVFDLNRELARSYEMETFLAASREQTAACQNVYALQRAIVRTEHFLAREISDWFTLSKEPRYG
jgi:hypothetical protein